MTIKARAWLAAAAVCTAAVSFPTAAAANSAAVDYFRNRSARTAVPSLLTQDERSYYRDLFGAIDKGDWTRVQALFAQKGEGPLHQVALAEYYLAPGSPRIELDALSKWLESGTALPQAEQIGNLALKRGATALPPRPSSSALVTMPSRAKRIRPREVNDGTMPAAVSASIQARIKADDPAGARALLDGIDTQLSPATRAEWRAKVAWSFYIENDDANAYALAQTANDGAGPWVAEGWWTAGLAAWRLDDCTGAADAFARTASASENSELTAAAWYWQARALVRCRQPEKASAPLKAAARMDETLYGMLAAEQLGLSLPKTHEAPDFSRRCATAAMSAPPCNWPRLAATAWRTRFCATKPGWAMRMNTSRCRALPAIWACPPPSCGWPTTPRAAARANRPRASPRPSGPPPTAGRSIPRWSMPMPCRNRCSAPA